MDDSLMVWKTHSTLYERLRKTFHYGHTKKPIKYPSLPLTEVTVNMICKNIVSQQQRLNVLDVNYAAYVLHQACISPASIMIAMIYLDRLKASDSYYLKKNSPCELFLVSLMVASKFLFDKGENELIYNDEWASIADLDTEDLNKIEREFLNALNWSCYVNQQTFMEQLVKFEALISANEIFKRSPNTMTYVELISIFKYLKFRHKDLDLIWLNIAEFAKSVVILSFAYCAAIGVILVSFSLVFSVHAIISKSNEPKNQNITLETLNTSYFRSSNLIDLDKSSQYTRYFFVRNLSNGYQQMYLQMLLKHKFKQMVKC